MQKLHGAMVMFCVTHWDIIVDELNAIKFWLLCGKILLSNGDIKTLKSHNCVIDVALSVKIPKKQEGFETGIKWFSKSAVNELFHDGMINDFM